MARKICKACGDEFGDRFAGFPERTVLCYDCSKTLTVPDDAEYVEFKKIEKELRFN